MNHSYIRVSTEKQTVENQRHEISVYCSKNNITLDSEISITVSSRKSKDKRRIDELVDSLNNGDTLIVSELSRLGRKTAETILLIDELLKKEITIILIKQGMNLSKHDPMSRLTITMLSAFCELERDMISQRTKEALAARKAQGVTLGRRSTGKYESIHKDIAGYFKQGMSTNQMAMILDVPVSSLRKYIIRTFKKEEQVQ